MKTKTINVYSFDELSDKAKKKAIQYFRESNWETGYAWDKENWDSMEKFAEIFPIKVREASYGGRGEGVSFYFTDDYNLEKMQGIRLAKYIWNNYRHQIFSRKWYNGTKRTKPNKYHKTNPSAPKFTTWDRYSKISIEDYNCPLTGYAMDNEILDEIYKFLKKPDNRNFKDLLEDCFNSWVKACNADRADQDSDEYLKETIEANEYEFDEDGNLI